MTALKVTQIGNSMGVVLPKEVMSELNVVKGDTLYLTKAPDGGMRLSPYTDKVAKQIHAAEEVMRQYRNTLRELAK